MIRVAIVTPREEALALDCNEVVVPGRTGEIGLAAGHVPLITTLRPGVLTVIESDRSRRFAIGTGYAEIDDDQLTVITEALLSPDQIDLDAAKADLAEAEKAMSGSGPEDPKFDEHTLSAQWAQARIDVRGAR